ncbi:MAG: hypothetical protein JJU15_13120 [Pararhodobacter sp.]|nr:hypothetical protein [Pararhodobacter sp.]
MTRIFHSRRLPALLLGGTVVGIAAAACGIPATQAGTASNGPVRCEISIQDVRGSTTIEGRVDSDRPVTGTYSLAISSRSSGGQAMINQSGDFSASPSAPAILGQTTLGGPRGQYTADLEVRVGGDRLSCTNGARNL